MLKNEPAISQNSGYIASAGHAAALYQNELYELSTGRSGTARLQQFGVIFGHQRVVLYVEPDPSDGGLSSNTARTQLLLNGETLPWAEWAAEFRDRLPGPISDLVSEVGGKAGDSDYRQAIRDRLKAIRDLLRLSRYKRSPTGALTAQEDPSPGGKPASGGGTRGTGDKKPGQDGGRAGDIYSLFLATDGIAVNELRQPEPDTTWVSVAAGTREPPDLDDRAAKYLPQANRILINEDFRVFQDMFDRWTQQYENVPGARKVVEQAVKEWFEQQLIESVMGVQTLRGSSEWTLGQLEAGWSEEALTAAVMPRYHIDLAVKRALGSKLGKAQERKTAAV